MINNIYGIIEGEVYSSAYAVIKKQEEYKKYIDTHIANVQRAFNEYLYPNLVGKDANVDKALLILKDLIVDHDASKYSDYEFEQYRKEFYPISDKEKEYNKEQFDIACKHHYATNSHHPEHWIKNNGEILNMPIADILEMICDWESFKYIGKGSAKEYWEKNKKEKSSIISFNTCKYIEYIFYLLNTDKEDIKYNI